MDIPKEDRRVRRTKKLLKQGLSELMKEKDFNDISIKDITERMDLNRGTFYLHYTDIYDLLEKIETDVLNDFQTMIDTFKPKITAKTIMPILEPIATYISENSDICKILFENKASNDFSLKFGQLVEKNGIYFIHQKYKDVNPDILEYYFSFITYGVIGLLREWFKTDMKLDKHTIVTICDKIISGAAENVLE